MQFQPMELLTNDTICAISTPPGMGGIAVIRISGPKALEIVDKAWSGSKLAHAKTHTAHLGNVIAHDGSPIDQCVATVFRTPGSYTGEDTVELSVHGSTYIQQAVITRLCSLGARLAEPGEFTRRAFTSGRIDLTQAEAIADLINARSKAAHRIAMQQMRGQISTRLESLRQQLIELGALLELELDFSEEDVEFADRSHLLGIAKEVDSEITHLLDSFARGSAIKQGIPVAIVGPTNVGKSSILNALVGDDRAIVSDIHGTTRDLIEDTIVMGDHMFRFIDTAGLRDTSDTVENLGIERTYRAIDRASIIIQVVDATRPDTDITLNVPAHATLIRVINKIDIPGEHQAKGAEISMSALTGQGIDRLRQALTHAAGDTPDDTQVLLTNVRQQQALQSASQAIKRVITSLSPTGTTSVSADYASGDILPI
ncbi:MAG: tRNA uridine-5-carboxymethylaminomethyl(34) synthesis GTPase MnmE, partial [Muribaculaceae bacterium]|nr:tRNA uridine-5-carboxymethylaminomethyl(34) synthesis GTPase MnmE [Muribaculaceae bacterium]